LFAAQKEFPQKNHTLQQHFADNHSQPPTPEQSEEVGEITAVALGCHHKNPANFYFTGFFAKFLAFLFLLTIFVDIFC